ncbi:MAG: hypothetical protein LW823_07970 [Rickettsiales bacterium]|jgi:hypothetical protein|nr:hypothetical protein [Rickettsiales bacterium]
MAGHLHLGEISNCNDIFLGIKTGPKDKTEGLKKAIKDAYAEVIRENKSLAAYMSKGQGAKLGA